jgi:hypothetical protein
LFASFYFLDLAQKKMKKLQLVLISLGFAISASSFAQVTIGSSDNGTTDTETSAILELESDTDIPKGFLLPTMTNEQRLKIKDPATGLQVYVTDFDEDGGIIMLYNGTEWKAFTELITCPEPPTIGTVTFNNKSEAIIPFTAPLDDGGSQITSYTATSDPEGATGTTQVDASSENGSITVSGLSANTSYTFTVTATNHIDTSDPSQSSSSVELIPKVGDFYQGGVVFYLLKESDKDVDGYDEFKTQGLICALEDLEGSYKWSHPINGVEQQVTETQPNMGLGKFNTAKIIAKLGEENKNYAAYQATTYLGDGYDDWYLPSEDELNRMKNNKSDIDSELSANGGTVFSTNDYYWSSSERDENNAYRLDISGGGGEGKPKSNTYLVRPVRSFL